jgi:hypothetical protein
MSQSEFISLRAYAKRRGVSPEAVSEAVSSGRLSASVTRNARGQPKIADPDLADREWEANTDWSRVPAFAPKDPDGLPEPDAEEDEMSTDGLPSANEGMSLLEASAIEKVWKAKLAELKFRKEAAQLLPASQVRRTLETTFSACKTKLLAVPSRARQALPHLAPTDIAEIERLVREALEGLSAGAT